MPEFANDHSHRGTRAIQRLVEYAPSTGGLALWVAHRHQDAPPSAPPIATDGTTIFYRDAFAALPLTEQTGLVAHEVLHIALRHPQRFLALNTSTGGADLQLFTICADAIVNSTLSHLSWLKLPEQSVFLDKLIGATLGIKRPVEKLLLEWDVERLYREIDDRGPQRYVVKRYGKFVEIQHDNQSSANRETAQQGGNGEGASPALLHAASEQQAIELQPRLHRDDGPLSGQVRNIGASSRADILPDSQMLEAPELEASAARDWSERLIRGHTNDGDFSMLRTLIADVPKSRTPWEQVLRTRLARGLSKKPDLSWSRPSRSYLANQGRMGDNQRLPWEPGTVSTKSVPRLAVIIDVSGSIDGKLMSRFAAEIEGIARRQDSALTLIIGDERVRDVHHFKPGQCKLGAIGFLGAGGTDFTPLIEEAATYDPDVAVVLTDLDGPARVKPRFPVIWAVPEAYASAKEPFGQKLVLR